MITESISKHDRPSTKLGRLLSALVLVVSLTGTLIVSQAAPASASAGGTALSRGQALYPGEYISVTYGGTNRTFWLIMQLDTNLVMYKGSSSHQATKVCWASNTADRGWNDTYAIYQQDGNFVLYDYGGAVLWASNTVGVRGTTVDISSYGQLWVGWQQMTSGC
ncbi:hypothetical protein Rhe02_11760 [Rhizocola hellebori]|uniref:Bulb-type lectin domain-containing protein n=1 Tax=Rhizocola hellebori TaxID=1392758 RepID=A0A8J3Q461_9ACTN|nr:hypothetical protein [Rhizocola hellebori]GIH03109.1 hypothetical protein Rhe02_11760 [Rhizocola hellebori]